MLTIREGQMKVFEEGALQRFEDEMVAHSEKFTPRLCKALGEEQLRVALRQAMKRADTYGFTNRGPIRLYIELMFLYGSDFDTDPQYPKIAEILNTKDDQMQRADEIYKFLLDYQEKVSGPDAKDLKKGLEAISNEIKQPDNFTADNLEVVLFQTLSRLFPQKADYIGEKSLKILIQTGRDAAQNHEFPNPRNEALVATMMFTLGHGCTNDPLYPWISRTLTNEKITDPEGRAKRLEKKAVTWLDQVLAGPWRGE